MKLPIKKKYFDDIKSGKKNMDFRDAHITFVCEETGETIVKKIKNVTKMKTRWLSQELRDSGILIRNNILLFAV